MFGTRERSAVSTFHLQGLTMVLGAQRRVPGWTWPAPHPEQDSSQDVELGIVDTWKTQGLCSTLEDVLHTLTHNMCTHILSTPVS